MIHKQIEISRCCQCILMISCGIHYPVRHLPIDIGDGVLVSGIVTCRTAKRFFGGNIRKGSI